VKARENGIVGQVPEDVHEQLVRDLCLLHDSRVMLVQRLERVVVALALTLDAESAAEQRLAQIQDLAGARRIGGRPSDDWSLLAQRYREVIHALETINEETMSGGGRLQ